MWHTDMLYSDGLCRSKTADQCLLDTWWWHRVDSRLSVKLSLLAARL